MFDVKQRMTFSLFKILFLSGLLLIVSGCTNPEGAKVASSTVVEALSVGQEQAYARPTEPIDFQFPLDHGPHPEYAIEWWYYTGNLRGDESQQYGYQLTFFRVSLTPGMEARASNLATNQLYMGHFAVTDRSARQHFSFERFSRGSGGLAGARGDPIYEVWLEDWSAMEIEQDVMRVQATAMHEEGTVGLDLTMRRTQAPLLHGDRGLSQKGPEVGNANYYYSLVQMETTGTVTTYGKSVEVHGLSWMDHEFGTSALSDDTVGWDWFSIQLENGVALMFGEFHNAEGEGRYVYEGTFSMPDGRQFSLGEGDFELVTLDEWTSPESGVTYPFKWRVRFPEYAIELTIEPIIADQEMDVSIVYYEGATQVQGTMGEEPVSGVGYVELTGYGAVSEYRR